MNYHTFCIWVFLCSFLYWIGISRWIWKLSSQPTIGAIPRPSEYWAAWGAIPRGEPPQCWARRGSFSSEQQCQAGRAKYAHAAAAVHDATTESDGATEETGGRKQEKARWNEEEAQLWDAAEEATESEERCEEPPGGRQLVWEERQGSDNCSHELDWVTGSRGVNQSGKAELLFKCLWVLSSVAEAKYLWMDEWMNVLFALCFFQILILHICTNDCWQEIPASFLKLLWGDPLVI